MLTWGDVLAYLRERSPEQLAQHVMVFPPHDYDGPVGLQPVYCLGTVAFLCYGEDGDLLQETWSADDHKHHPEQIVLLADSHPFSDDGDFFYEVTEDGLVGDKTGKPPE